MVDTIKCKTHKNKSSFVPTSYEPSSSSRIMKEDTVNNTKINVPKLNDTNYNYWWNAMETLLSAKGLFKYCLNEKKAVAMNDLLVYFNNDQKCKAIIGLNVESRYYPIIKSSKTAYQAWTKLQHECVKQ